ncbi:MAG: glycosyl hydrolase family 65 protein [Pseudomonadota bacterium]
MRTNGNSSTVLLPVEPTATPEWVLVEEGFHPAREHEIESLFSVANGLVGTRGSVAEGSSFSAPATFVAGLFDVPSEGTVPELVVCPDWLRLRIVAAGHELKLEQGSILEHRRRLDMRQGLLWRDWRHLDPTGRITRIQTLRLASLDDRHLLLLSLLLSPENYGGTVLFESWLDGAATGTTPEDGKLVPIVLAEGAPPMVTARRTGGEVVAFKTRTRGTVVAFCSLNRLSCEESTTFRRHRGPRHLIHAERWQLEVEIGKSYRLDRLVGVYTSREPEPPIVAAGNMLKRLARRPANEMIVAHGRAWEEHWRAADVVVQGDSWAQTALRFAVYHLISSTNPDDERVSVGARSLTGKAYKGHVFWDTEIYLVPFHVLTNPAAARSLVMYRYHTLPAAKHKARSLGYRGALYPWESADTGEETTPPFVLAPDGEIIPILSGQEEHHISADVAYAAWQYWQVTADDGFFEKAGAEMIIETARFWASRGRMEHDGRYHIRKVMGPDEYHETVDDDAYTNVMAQWNLERALEAVQVYSGRWPESWRDLRERLQLAPEELSDWQRIVETMHTGFDAQTGLFEQFSGYFELEDIDVSAFADRTVPLDVLLGRERIQRSQVVKQPDVVMLLALLWNRFSPAVREANFRYYDRRTGHGSSLSPPIHALVAARLGDAALAERYFKQTADIDLANNMGNAAGGVHIAALGGLWQAAVLGVAGADPGEECLAFDPGLFRGWQEMRFVLRWRGRRVRVALLASPARIELLVESGTPATIRLEGGEDLVAESGISYAADKEKETGEWSTWRQIG